MLGLTENIDRSCKNDNDIAICQTDSKTSTEHKTLGSVVNNPDTINPTQNIVDKTSKSITEQTIKATKLNETHPKHALCTDQEIINDTNYISKPGNCHSLILFFCNIIIFVVLFFMFFV